MSQPVVLASTSRARRAVLAGAGLEFQAVDSGLDEEAAKTALKSQGASPRKIAEALAEAKAVKASAAHNGLVIGADQTLEFEGALYDKVETLEAARARLKLLRGRPHRLHSAVVVAQGGAAVWRNLASATLTMRDFSDGFLEAYLATEGEAALGSVGCYRLEGPGAQLFSAIEGDYFAILGLPLLGLLEFLRQHGALAT
ncbi:Maf family protein [Phenylobacterium sp.]|uniref:Maf family protein n=1 Tax=Phenylobacterium sp. TaxID=1871053 RepID=UPI002DF000FE|nr:Maf family protein [Phenylobacterium sp.]